MFRNVGSKEFCLSLSVISLASLIVHPVEACSRVAPMFDEFDVVADASDTTAPRAPGVAFVNRGRGEPPPGCNTEGGGMDCSDFSFADLVFVEEEESEDVGYIVGIVERVDGYLENQIDRPIDLPENRILHLQWGGRGPVDVTLSISAVDRAGNLSEPVEVHLAF